MAGDLAREVIQSMRPAFPFDSRPARHLVNLRDSENPFGGTHRHYPDNRADDLVARYVRALDVVEAAPGPGAGGWRWGPDTVLITRGAADGLDLIFRTLFEPGADAVAVTPPTFTIFDELAAVYRIARHPVPLLGADLRRLDVERLASLPVKGVILCDPGNPTGTRLDPGDVRRLLASFHGPVVIDEAYVECTGGPSHRHLIPEHPHLVVVRSMSKALGMAGLRLGAVLAHPGVVAALRKTRLPFALPAPVTAQAVAELSRPALLRRRIGAFRGERDRLAAGLAGCPGVGRVFAEAGFVTLEADAGLAAGLRRAGFDVVADPMGWSGHVRLGVGSPADNSRLLAALRAGPPPSRARGPRSPARGNGAGHGGGHGVGHGGEDGEGHGEKHGEGAARPAAPSRKKGQRR